MKSRYIQYDAVLCEWMTSFLAIQAFVYVISEEEKIILKEAFYLKM